ncbi:MAG TPA: hypothetical protein VMX56_01545 [Anaerolineales bacterium]|nr:hypothetical protein [Anaerolineales bacterium]
MTEEEQKAYAQRRKEQWEACSSEAREAAKALKKADLLQIPREREGWGLSACLLIWTAEEIDKVWKNKTVNLEER